MAPMSGRAHVGSMAEKERFGSSRRARWFGI
jgi:hypothetical protein